MVAAIMAEQISGTSKKTSPTDRGSKNVIGMNRGDFSSMTYAKKEKSNEAHVLQIENASPSNGKAIETTPKQSMLAKWRAHYKRWWICYTIGGIAFLAIFLPVL